MKAVVRYEYTVELTEEQFQQVQASWEFEVLEYMEHPPQTEQELRREVVQYLIQKSHVGDFTEFVTETETSYDEYTENS